VIDTQEVIRRIADRKTYDGNNIQIDLNQLVRALALDAPPLKMMIAEISASIAAASLHIPTPSVVEIMPGEHEANDGFAGFSNVIHVRLQGNCACRVALVAVHEVRHRWQMITERFAGMLSGKKHEVDADEFAEEFFERFELRGRCPCGGPYK